MKSNHLFALVTTLSAYGCGIFGTEDCAPRSVVPQLQPEKLTIQEGVWGQLSFWEGSFALTTPEFACNRGTVTPVQRVVLVYEPTLGSMATPSGEYPHLLSSVSTAVVDSVLSDATGFFEIAVPPGEYSILVREDEFLYSWTGVVPVVIAWIRVSSGEAYALPLQIRYKATS